MSEHEGDLAALATRVGDLVEHFAREGHTVRALVELRALLDATGFWGDPDRASPVTDHWMPRERPGALEGQAAP